MAEHYLYDADSKRFFEQDDIALNNPCRVGNISFTILNLLRQEYIDDPAMVSLYFKEFTLPYLESALKGVCHVIDPKYTDPTALQLPPIDFMYEAADHARIVLAQIPETYKLRDKNLSKNGLLKAPKTVFDHQRRIVEVGYTIEQIIENGLPTTADVSLLRTFAYFYTASEMFNIFPQGGLSQRNNGGLLNPRSIDLALPPLADKRLVYSGM